MEYKRNPRFYFAFRFCVCKLDTYSKEFPFLFLGQNIYPKTAQNCGAGFIGHAYLGRCLGAEFAALMGDGNTTGVLQFEQAPGAKQGNKKN